MNIDAIMDEIRTDIAAKGYQESDIKSFAEVKLKTDIAQQDCFDLENYESLVSKMNRDYVLTLERPLDTNPIKKIVQKIVRKLIRFYIEPVTLQQQEYNIDIVKTMNEIRLYQIQNMLDFEELNGDQKNAAYEMAMRVRELEKELKEVKAELEQLKSEK